jgi:hypothetical protein
MATPAVATETQSRIFYTKFVDWAKSQNLVPSPQLLEEWDVKHNHNQFRDQVFGGNAAIHRAGLTALYSRYFYNLSSMTFEKPDGTGSISVTPYRYIKETGTRADILSPKTTQSQRDFMKEKLDSMVVTLIAQSELLGMTRKELLTYIEEK